MFRCNMDMRAYALKAALAAELDEMSAARSCEAIIDAFMDDADVFRSINCAFAKARMLWHEGRREECLELLERKRPVIDETGSIYFATQLAVLCASYHAEMGHDARAMVELSRSVELAMHGGFKSVFLEGRTCMHELLLQLATSRKSSYAVRNHAKSVLLLFDTEEEIKDKMAFREGARAGLLLAYRARARDSPEAQLRHDAFRDSAFVQRLAKHRQDAPQEHLLEARGTHAFGSLPGKLECG